MLSDAEGDPELSQPFTILDRELVAAHVQFLAKVKWNFLRPLTFDDFAILKPHFAQSVSRLWRLLRCSCLPARLSQGKHVESCEWRRT